LTTHPNPGSAGDFAASSGIDIVDAGGTKTSDWRNPNANGAIVCDGEMTYAVKGQVLLADGRPVSGGQIEFRATDKPISAIGYLQTDGSFELSFRKTADGTVAGAYTVALVEPPPPGIPGKESEEAPLAKVRSQWLADVPAKYRSMKTAGLTFEAKQDAEANEFRIVVQP
jgi:hypothetical protein